MLFVAAATGLTLPVRVEGQELQERLYHSFVSVVGVYGAVSKGGGELHFCGEVHAKVEPGDGRGRRYGCQLTQRS